jgi:phage shock protein PspC (stress-responsive transcriptional regulator)
MGMIEHMNEKPSSTFRRTREDKMIAGVCSGLSRQFGWDANIIRLVWAIVTFLTGGTAAAVYGIVWLLIPEEGAEKSIAQDLIDKNTKR